MSMRRLVPLALTASLLTGCGAIVHGTRQDIPVQADPDAQVRVNPDGGTSAVPATLNLERKRSYVLTFSSPGYESEKLEIRNNLNGWVLTADILLGVVGVVVDGLTGSWYTLKPGQATVTLRRRIEGDQGPEEVHIQLNGTGDGAVQVRSDVPVTVNVRAK